MSETEPEMGLGLVVGTEFRQVQILFPSTGETRLYSSENAPLKRVQFQPGDTIHTHEGAAHVIESISNADGIFHYECGGTTVPEMHLADTIQLGTADRRLLDGRVDTSGLFALRGQAWRSRSQVHTHPAHGYMGARMDLIPHQLYIAGEVASRAVPRVLLADEVGLGKTIEACLILHRLMVDGRAGRVLILVPEPLIHQWFVELLRRFNLTCAIYDEERCASIQGEERPGGEDGEGEKANPFLEEHLILTSLELFRNHPDRLEEALAADWGMVIVDEVHHLKWSPPPGKPSWEYSVVEAFSRLSQGLLLLTGTPEQFGEKGHFARLRLLDPDRFHDYRQFCKEAESYHQTAAVVDKLILGEAFTKQEFDRLRKLFSGVPRLEAQVEQMLSDTLSASRASEIRQELIRDLLDRHGTGRVVFRNTRSAISGFPKRKVHGVPLRVAQSVTDDTDYAALAAREMEVEFPDPGGSEENDGTGAKGEQPGRLPSIGPKDPRIDWLVKLLKKYPEEKILLICRYRERACAIHEALLQRLNIKMTVFHEELSLVQRDRNAAWFAEPDGARLLICSEIGSEGRNFQFAHHLVLFDLPVDPELLEQRIGRLDRIGQKADIHLHVPYFKGTGGENLFRWFHEGLDAFEHSVTGGALFLEKFQDRVRELVLHPGAKTGDHDLQELILETRAFRKELVARLEQGRDRLLELHSFQPAPAEQLIAAIREWDADETLRLFIMAALDHYGVHIEELSQTRWLLTPGHLLNDELAVIPDEGMMVTLDRREALERDDVEFLTWDHPLVTSVLDFMLGSETGNASFVEVATAEGLERGLMVEMIFILEGICPPQYNIGRFLASTPIRVICDQNGEILTSDAVNLLDSFPKKDLPRHVLSGNTEGLKPLLKSLKESAEEVAGREAEQIRQRAMKDMRTFTGREQERLRELRARNGLVSAAELKKLETEAHVLAESIESSQIRLDAIRLIRVR